MRGIRINMHIQTGTPATESSRSYAKLVDAIQKFIFQILHPRYI